jgi:hypothetical protein
MPPNIVVTRHENGTKFMTVELDENGLKDVETHTSGSLSDAQDILDTVSQAFFNKPVTLDELTKAIKERAKSAI